MNYLKSYFRKHPHNRQYHFVLEHYEGYRRIQARAPRYLAAACFCFLLVLFMLLMTGCVSSGPRMEREPVRDIDKWNESHRPDLGPRKPEIRPDIRPDRAGFLISVPFGPTRQTRSRPRRFRAPALVLTLTNPKSPQIAAELPVGLAIPPDQAALIQAFEEGQGSSGPGISPPGPPTADSGGFVRGILWLPRKGLEGLAWTGNQAKAGIIAGAKAVEEDPIKATGWLAASALAADQVINSGDVTQDLIDLVRGKKGNAEPRPAQDLARLRPAELQVSVGGDGNEFIVRNSVNDSTVNAVIQGSNNSFVFESAPPDEEP